MLEFLLNILRATPVVSALLIVAAVNTRRQYRVRQAWVPAIAVLFSLIALVVLYRVNDAVATGAEQANQVFPFLPANIGTAWLYVAENSFVILVFAALKVLTRPVFTRLFSKGTQVAQLLVARVYSYDSDFDLWFVERRFRRTRDFYRSLYWSSMAVTVGFIAFALTFPGWPGFTAVAFPALATMIIGEFYFAVDGLTKDEYESELFGEQDASRRIGNYGPLREVLESTFPDRVIVDGVHLSSLAAMESAFRVGEMTRSPEPGIRLAGSYFERLRLEGHDIDVNLVAASAHLIAGKNVLFANPFYKDLTPYLALPAYRTLLEGHKCLVIAGRDSVMHELRDWISDGLADITGIPDLWRVRPLDSVSRDETDVGILRLADLHNVELLVNNDEFFRDVGLLVLAEPALMLGTGQLGLEIILDRCARESPVAVAAFDANHDGLVDTLSHLIKANLTEVVASSLPLGASCEVVWQSDGPHLHTSILPGVSRYLGVGTELSAVALKYQVDKVHWVGGTSFPVTDMKWIAEQYYAPINQFADLEMSQDALGERIEAVASPWQLPRGDNYFLVVEDEAKNVYETVRQFATRASRSGFINLISDDYLLRDYMATNREVFSVDPKAIPSIVPDYTRTERNVVLRLLLVLKSFGLSDSELEDELAMLRWSRSADSPQATNSGGGDWEPEALRHLRVAIGKHTQCHDAPISSVTQPGTEAFEMQEARYFLEDGSALDSVLAGLGPAYFFVEDDTDGVNVIGSMLLGHVYQAMLPGMFLTYGGKYYEVQSIHGTNQRPRVILRRAADHIRDRRSYRQLRRYSIANTQPRDAVGAIKAIGAVQVRRIAGDVLAESLGYIESDTRSQISGGHSVHVSGIPSRKYVGKDILEIDLSEATDEVRRSIAVLLSELFVTVFPHGSNFIAVATEDDARSVGDLLPQFALDDVQDQEHASPRTSIYVFEDSMIDLGLTSAVERNWERLFEIVTDYLAWNLEDVAEPDEDPAPIEVSDPSRLFPDRPAVTTPYEAGFLARIRERLLSAFSRGRKAIDAPAHQPGSPEQWPESFDADQSSQMHDARDGAHHDIALTSDDVDQEAADPPVEESASSTNDADGNSTEPASASDPGPEAGDTTAQDPPAGEDGPDLPGRSDATQ